MRTTRTLGDSLFPAAVASGKGSTFREPFDVMVRALRADARIQALDAELLPPAPPAAMKKAEQAIEWALPAAMRAFYKAHSGFFLRWGRKRRSYPKLKRFAFPDQESAPGCINMLRDLERQVIRSLPRRHGVGLRRWARRVQRG